MVLFWTLSCDVLLEQMLQRMHDVQKECKCNPTESEGCSGIGSLCNASLAFADDALTLLHLTTLNWSLLVVTL